FLGGVLPAMWSFMLAARARGLGTAWTTMHLAREREVADLLGIPYDSVQQVCLSPLAYTVGTDFKPGRRPSAEDVIHWDGWDAGGEITTALDGLIRLPDDEWRTMLAVHLDGTFYGTRAAARSMVARRSGVIVNISSVCGVEGCTGFPHYSAAKAGILGFTRAV